jgi:hypoxanthine-guanine phosphoribosyltransferase
VTALIEALASSVNARVAKEAWIDQEPSDACFSDTPKSLAAFADECIEDQEERTRMISHLLRCERCSYAVANLVRAMECGTIEDDGHENAETRNSTCGAASQAVATIDERNWVEWFEAIGLRRPGPTVFPDGSVADRAWEFGHLLDHSRRDEVLNRIAEAGIRRLDFHRPGHAVLLVAFSDAMHEVSLYMAARMKEKQGDDLDVHVVGVKRYHEPCLLCKPTEVKGRSVVIVTDVVHDGRLLETLCAIVQKHQPSDIHALTMVNQNYDGPLVGSLVSLAFEQKETRTPFAQRRMRGITYYHPVSGVSEQSPPGQGVVAWNPNEIREWLPFIERTGAFKRSLRIGSNVYPFAINVLDLLKDEGCRKKIVSQAVASLGTLDTRKRWLFVYPASRGKRAGRIAQLLSSATGWQRIALGKSNDPGLLHVTPQAQQALHQCDGVIIVDAAIRTGDTLRAQLDLLELTRSQEIIAFYVLDLRREGCRHPPHDTSQIQVK